MKAELDLPVVLIFWTDSTAVIHCIKNNTKRFPVFVANRLAIIEQNTQLDCWRHVPSNLNSADLASRGIRANSNKMKKWLEGPRFLTKPRTEWPTNTLSNLTLTKEGLVTLMTEVEGILNSRLLVSLMLHDSEEEPLTPNHLPLLKGNPNLPPGTFDTNSCYTRRHWAYVQFLANQFWQRWTKEFLLNLLQRQKWFNRERNFEIGDVVLLVEDMQHRSNWVVGREIRTLTDKEGLVRVAQVKACNSVLTRPVTKLCLIKKQLSN